MGGLRIRPGVCVKDDGKAKGRQGEKRMRRGEVRGEKVEMVQSWPDVYWVLERIMEAKGGLEVSGTSAGAAAGGLDNVLDRSSSHRWRRSGGSGSESESESAVPRRKKTSRRC